MSEAFRRRLQDPKPLLLDGATGTELARRGIDLSHPSWTAGVLLDSSQVLQQIHADYVAAGAEVITANTFRTHARNVRSLPGSHDAAMLTRRAVELAREVAGPRAFVAGSVAPLEDCYSPELTPSPQELTDEHAHMAQALAESVVDLILVETQVTVREGRIAAEAARRTGLPFFVSFVVGRDGRLLSGEPLEEAFSAVAECEPQGLLVNCIPAAEVGPVLEPFLKRYAELRLGAYANTGRLMPDGRWEGTTASEPAVYAGYVRRWLDSGMGVVGGCCGTRPEHISAIAAIA